MFFMSDGFFAAYLTHSSSSILPSPFVSASVNVCVVDYHGRKPKKKLQLDCLNEIFQVTEITFHTLSTIVSIISSDKSISDAYSTFPQLKLHHNLTT